MYPESSGQSTNKLRPTPRMSSFNAYLIFSHMTIIIMSIQGLHSLIQHHRLKNESLEIETLEIGILQ